MNYLIKQRSIMLISSNIDKVIINTPLLQIILDFWFQNYESILKKYKIINHNILLKTYYHKINQFNSRFRFQLPEYVFLSKYYDLENNKTCNFNDEYSPMDIVNKLHNPVVLKYFLENGWYSNFQSASKGNFLHKYLLELNNVKNIDLLNNVLDMIRLYLNYNTNIYEYSNAYYQLFDNIFGFKIMEMLIEEYALDITLPNDNPIIGIYYGIKYAKNSLQLFNIMVYLLDKNQKHFNTNSIALSKISHNLTNDQKFVSYFVKLDCKLSPELIEELYDSKQINETVRDFLSDSKTIIKRNLSTTNLLYIYLKLDEIYTILQLNYNLEYYRNLLEIINT
jgi:hypothetical protein